MTGGRSVSCRRTILRRFGAPGVRSGISLEGIGGAGQLDRDLAQGVGLQLVAIDHVRPLWHLTSSALEHVPDARQLLGYLPVVVNALDVMVGDVGRVRDLGHGKVSLAIGTITPCPPVHETS